MEKKDIKYQGRTNRINRNDETYIRHQMRTQVNSLTLTGNEDLGELQWDFWNNIELLILRDKTKENKIVVIGSSDEKDLIEFVSNAEIDKKNSTIKIKHDTTKENILLNKNERLLSLVSVAEGYKLDKTQIEVLSDEWKENTLTNGNEKLLQISYTDKDSEGRSKTVITVLQDKELLQMIKDLQNEIVRIDKELKQVNELIVKNKELADAEFLEIKTDLAEYKKEVTEKLNNLKSELTNKIDELETSLKVLIEELKSTLNKDISELKESQKETNDTLTKLSETVADFKATYNTFVDGTYKANEAQTDKEITDLYNKYDDLLLKVNEVLNNSKKEEFEKDINDVNQKLKDLEEKLNNGDLSEEEKEQAEKEKEELNSKLNELENAIKNLPTFEEKEKDIAMIYSMYEDFREFENGDSFVYPNRNILTGGMAKNEMQSYDIPEWSGSYSNIYLNVGIIEEGKDLNALSFEFLSDNESEKTFFAKFLIGTKFVETNDEANGQSETDEFQAFEAKNLKTNANYRKGLGVNLTNDIIGNKKYVTIVLYNNFKNEGKFSFGKVKGETESYSIFTTNPNQDLTFAYPDYIGIQVKNKGVTKSDNLEDYTTFKITDFYSLGAEIEKHLSDNGASNSEIEALKERLNDLESFKIATDEQLMNIENKHSYLDERTLILEEKVKKITLDDLSTENLFIGNLELGQTTTLGKSVLSEEFSSVKFTFKTPYGIEVIEKAFEGTEQKIQLTTMRFNESSKEIEFNEMKIDIGEEDNRELTVAVIAENQHAYGKFTTIVKNIKGSLLRIDGIKGSGKNG